MTSKWSKHKFPDHAFVRLEGEGSEDLYAYRTMFEATQDEGQWTNVGVYRLHEVRRSRKIVDYTEVLKVEPPK
jgi:hypothetical protein